MPSRLSGVRVVVTRPESRAAGLVAALRAEGAEVVRLPMLRVVPPADPAPLRDAAAKLAGRPAAYDRLVFTSVHAVRALTEALAAAWAERSPDGSAERSAPPAVPTACVGETTGAAARAAGWAVDTVPDRSGAEALVEALTRVDVTGLRVLFPRAEDARPVLARGLRAAGAEVDDVVAYRKVRPDAAGPDDEGVAGTGVAGAAEGADVLTFTSPSTVRAYFEVVEAGSAAALPAVVIGPTTAAAFRRVTGREPVVAGVASVDGLVSALIEMFEARREE